MSVRSDACGGFELLGWRTVDALVSSRLSNFFGRSSETTTEYLLVQEQELQYCRDVEIFYVFNCVIEVLTKLAAAMKKTRRPVNETR
ncbi:hypothetical protein PC116_g17959 [Phytophthora cactorum]|nr:hypothetical protein PC116_g17959 [Phytophthora cactorum]